jgi:hypothetical protein
VGEEKSDESEYAHGSSLRFVREEGVWVVGSLNGSTAFMCDF